VVEYCTITVNQVGIRCSGSAAPVIAEGDSIGCGLRGIICQGTSHPSMGGAVIDACNIGILAKGSSYPAIGTCRVKGCQKGVSLEGSASPAFEVGCEFYDNGVGLYLNGNGNGVVTMDGCTVRDNDTYGIEVLGSTHIEVSHSEIRDNSEGIVAFGSADCLLGTSSPEEAGYNNIYGNPVCNVRNATTAGDTLLAENCWWGSVPPDTARICGLVDYQPYLTGEAQLMLPPGGPQWRAGSGQIVELQQMLPMPAKDYVTVCYSVNNPGAKVNLSVFNVRGQKVATLVDKWMDPGAHTVAWRRTSERGGTVEPGVYFCVLQADGSTVEARKLVVVGGSATR
jgi:hypothetical protein